MILFAFHLVSGVQHPRKRQYLDNSFINFLDIAVYYIQIKLSSQILYTIIMIEYLRIQDREREKKNKKKESSE